MSKSGNLTVCVQAGGESRRMGRSKATVPFLGEPLLLRSINRLLPISEEFIVNTNEPEALDFVPVVVRLGLVVEDVRGALQGLRTAFASATNEFVAITAVDMIFPSRNIIAEELRILKKTGADACVPHSGNGFEPFHGVYRRESCLAAVEAALARGEKRAMSWFGDVKLVALEGTALEDAEPRGGSFINTNTPEELARMEAKITAGEMKQRMPFTLEGRAPHPSHSTVAA